ncbi:unnamed protein product [Dovyalis caffra]|uniref:Uncharacterized protein n=1 Tax=Dovyalis caffra TaxID=77055 RepID=A0AAV1QWM3_9ROSI|nr:unnamed protein product [Dovyalis caffra]
MDLWVVAVAAGAGYAVKANYFKNSSRRLKESALESFSLDYFHSQSQSWNLLQRIREQTCPCCRLGVCKHSETDGSFGRDFIGVPSNSATKCEVQLQSHRPCGMGYFFDLSSELLPDSVIGEVSSLRRFTADRQLGSRSRGYINKSLDSSDSILTPELYGGHPGFEEYYSPSSSTEMARPLTIGSWIIGGSHDFGQEMQVEKEKGALMLTRKQIQNFDMGPSRGLSKSRRRVSGGLFYPQGTSDEMLPFFLGITVGIMSNVAANKREVDYLNELLKQNENLVQDLHEELKMKDLLTVKELASEDSDPQETTEKQSSSASSEVSTKKELDKSIKFDGREPDDEKAENSEAMSKIEAELEAELERLELNMKSSSLERMLDLVEMNPNFELDVEGDLGPNEGYKKPDHLSDSDDDPSRISTDPTETANYAVSSKELSLRLHEIIQSRLVVRIMELEYALENSQKRLHVLDEVESSSIQQFATSGKADEEREPAFDEVHEVLPDAKTYNVTRVQALVHYPNQAQCAFPWPDVGIYKAATQVMPNRQKMGSLYHIDKDLRNYGLQQDFTHT